MPGIDEVRRLSAAVSNWGRWGEDDQLGTLNLITPEMVADAARLVRRGQTFSLALPFGVPFFLAVIYPLVRWLPQEWTLDERGITGRGRAAGTCPWDALARWTITPAAGLADVFHVAFRRAPAWRSFPASMMVRAADRAAVESWLGRGRGGGAGSA